MPTWPNRSVEIYIILLKDDDYRVRRQAAAALGVLADHRAVDSLTRMVVDDESSDVRAASARALGMLGEVRAVESLIISLRDVDPRVRSAAVRALSKLPDQQAEIALAGALHDSDSNVRYDAEYAVGRIASVLAVVPLLEILARGPDSAAEAAIAQIGAASTSTLISAIKHEDNRVRALGAKYLGQVGIPDQRTIDALTESLQDEDPEVRRQAAESLQELNL